MRTARRKIEEIAWALGFDSAALYLDRPTKWREAAKRRKGLQSFFSAFLREGDLAFDIGANRGLYADAMESAGAKVVAVEPNPDCVRHIQLAHPHKRIEVIHAAVGPHCGLAQICISDEKDEVSTLSPDWQKAMLLQHENWRGYWNRTLTVPVVTLDHLCQQYGQPQYIKIDVEGAEEGVLAGLVTLPAVLSFEFNTACKGAALACIHLPLFRRNCCEFNIAWVDESYTPSFELSGWQSAEQLGELLSGMDSMDRHGDIFVRRTRQGKVGHID